MPFDPNIGFIPKTQEELQEDLRLAWNAFTGATFTAEQWIATNIFNSLNNSTVLQFLNAQSLVQTKDAAFFEFIKGQQEFIIQSGGATYDGAFKALKELNPQGVHLAYKTIDDAYNAGECAFFLDQFDPTKIEDLRMAMKSVLTQGTSTNTKGGVEFTWATDQKLNASFSLDNSQPVDCVVYNIGKNNSGADVLTDYVNANVKIFVYYLKDVPTIPIDTIQSDITDYLTDTPIEIFDAILGERWIDIQKYDGMVDFKVCVSDTKTTKDLTEADYLPIYDLPTGKYKWIVDIPSIVIENKVST